MKAIGKRVKVFKFEISNFTLGEEKLYNEYAYEAEKRLRTTDDICNTINEFLVDKELIDIQVVPVTTSRHNNGRSDTVKLIYTLTYIKIDRSVNMKTRFVDTDRGSILRADENGNVLIEVWAHKKLVHVSLVNRGIRNSKGIEKFVGVSQCPKDKVFNVGLETQIARARAEVKEQFALVNTLREQRTDEY